MKTKILRNQGTYSSAEKHGRKTVHCMVAAVVFLLVILTIVFIAVYSNHSYNAWLQGLGDDSSNATAVANVTTASPSD